MKFNISYTVQTMNRTVWYTEDNDLNFDGSPIEAESENEALTLFKGIVTELMQCNCLSVNIKDNSITVYEPSDREFIECYYNFSAVRIYALLDKNGQEYYSLTPGIIGGYKRKKIYGRLDCPSAKRYIAKGEYVKHRVFFADEETAKSAGYRPCGICMKEEYKKWKECKQDTTAKEMD